MTNLEIISESFQGLLAQACISALLAIVGVAAAELAEKGVTSAAQFGRIIHAMQVRTYAKNLKKLNAAKSKLCVTRTTKCGTISNMAKGFKNATLALALTAVGVVASCRASGASPDILRGGGCSQESRVAALCKRILKAQTKDIGEIPFYKIGTFGKSPNAYMSRAVYDEYVKKYSYPTKGDILISAAGTIGRAVVFDGEPAYFQDSNIVWLEHDRQRLLNEYLLYFYLSNPWSISVGVTIPRIYNGDIESLEIPAPPIAAQREIVSVLDAAKEKCEKLKVAAECGLRAAEDLRKAILAEAFE